MKVKLISAKFGWQRLSQDYSFNYVLTVETRFLKRRFDVEREIGIGVNLKEQIGKIIII